MDTRILAAVGLGVGLILFAVLVLWVRRALEVRRMRRRFRRGRAGQEKARDYLQARGFEVLAEEHMAQAHVEVDGELLPYQLRVDFIVGKGRLTYAVEVKTGKQAPDPMHRATRRQLLEYCMGLDVDGLYLLDMESPRLLRIRFPGLVRGGRPGWIWGLICGLILGAGLVSLLVSAG